MRCSRIISILLSCAILGIGPSCGKKAAPFLSQEKFLLSVANVKGKWEKDTYILEGGIQGPVVNKATLGSISGCRVYYATYPLDRPPCADCPIEYDGFYGFGPEVVVNDSFTCRFPGQMEGRTIIFNVYLLGPNGAIGPPSDRIQVGPIL